MKITYRPEGINNFHNSRAINLVVTGEKTESPSGRVVYRVSAGQAARIHNHFCGISDCMCPHGAVEQLNMAGTEFGIRVGYCD